ncbi:hypothetical protein SAMN04487948_108108 [Halogranum amylolyticum]|uniref:Uncharacterized protein n=1 Tax=Halogranum amylolyticum TaxID=660520 RepID=A0A1H8TTL7_9EURY|nr:hypothetical protein [Halogranum amylolyticum]SEO94185.1 hypothetical protein SAMN04487948_108108 [Halogranum amylolyticum]
MVPSTVEWSGRPPGRLAAVVRHVGAGVYLAVALSLAFAIAAVALGGSLEFVLLFVVVLVVGGPFSLLYLWYALRYGEDEEKRTLRDHLPELELRWLALATPVGFALFLSLGAAPWLILVYTVVGLFAWTVATTGSKGGTLDTETGVLTREHDDRRLEHDLSGLKSFRSFRLGPYVVCALRHTQGNALDAPFGLVVPADVFDEVRPALRQLSERNEASEPKLTADRAILVGIGLLFVAVAAALEFATQTDGIGWVLAAWGALFVLLAWVA